jgi:hypothetical protein
MRNGKEIMAWNEPKEWLKAAKDHAKSDGIKVYPIKEMLITFAILGALFAIHWSQADAENRIEPLGALGVFMMLCLTLFALIHLKIMLNKTRTSLRENGILHGPRFSPRWIPFDLVEIFWIEDAEIEGKKFRFLTWFELGEEEEGYAVIPEEIDPRGIAEFLKSKSVKQDFPCEQSG